MITLGLVMLILSAMDQVIKLVVKPQDNYGRFGDLVMAAAYGVGAYGVWTVLA